ncbi:MAG: putative DNA binding domain-containing protein [Prevotella sp.]|nr:putative DNA binding domain-containing protein [Prevotella sp.]
MDLHKLIGETTSYEKKEMVEKGKIRNWLKTVSAFANGEGGILIFGVTDKDEIIGLGNAKSDAEFISESIKTKIDPVPNVNLKFKQVDEKTLILLYIEAGEDAPYYYVGDKQQIAYTRIGNESVVADRIQLKRLVIKGSKSSFDVLPSSYKFDNMSFSRLKSIHYKRLRRSFEDSEYASWGIIDENGNLTNAGALIADESPMRQSRIFCTRWNGLTMTGGLGEAIDDVELEGSVIGQLQDAVSFIRNNSKKKWWKEADHREELPDYPERSVTEIIANAIIHRDYMIMGSEIHVDMYDDRLEVYSPGGMFDGSLIQNLNPLAVISKRRNPLLADFFSRLGIVERRGSGMKKIFNAYKQFEHIVKYRVPEFRSNATEFHVVLWNMNYDESFNKSNEFTKKKEEFIKEGKEFAKASRQIYKLITLNSQISAIRMATEMNVSSRQVQKYLRKLQEQKKIMRVGGRKMGYWKIIDDDYENFFERI